MEKKSLIHTIDTLLNSLMIGQQAIVGTRMIELADLELVGHLRIKT